MLCSKSTWVLIYPLAGYKFEGSPTFTDLIDHTTFENGDASPSERGLHCIFFHWVRAVCHSILLAPRRYVIVFTLSSTPKHVRHSLEYGHLLVHDLGWAWMLITLH